jgi:hypothetical protein
MCFHPFLASFNSTHDFSLVLNLPPGPHRLKFIVDESWKCSDDLATATDGDGTLVNYIEVRSCLSPSLHHLSRFLMKFRKRTDMLCHSGSACCRRLSRTRWTEKLMLNGEEGLACRQKASFLVS